MKKSMLLMLGAATHWALIPVTYAQDVDDDEPFELSPFTVDTSGDQGYRAENTLAGSRLNTSLRDVASSVSVFTEAFIEDLGVQSIDELADYTTNMYVYYDEDADGGPGVTSDRIATQATNIVQRIRIRGVDATKGIDFFRSITPSDGYRIGRYDESRGPNSILFGLSSAGGIVNSTSIGASTQRNSGRLRITHEDTGGFRTEVRLNRVLLEDKLGVAVAAVDAENEEWQVGTYDDTERIFGAITFKANDRSTFRANYESGTETFSNQSRAPALDFGGQAFYDWARYLTETEGNYDRLLLTPRNNNNPAGDEAANFPEGLRTQRNSGSVTAANNGGNRRYVFVTNDGAFYDSSGSFFFRSYGDQRVSAPPDANWENGSLANGGRPRMNQPDLLPRTLNTDGPGAFKDYNFENYSLFANFRLAENLYLDLSHNYQKVDLLAYNIGGFAFQLNAENNLTRGLNNYGNRYPNAELRNPGYGPNPFAGTWYLESNWRKDERTKDIESTRLAMSYELDTERLGQHRFAVMLDKADEFDYRTQRQLGLLGRPYSTHWNNPANRIETRTYFNFDDPVQNPEGFHIGSWEQQLGAQYTLDDRLTGEPIDVEVGWTNRIPGNGNKAGTQSTDTRLFVMQNHWFNRKLVTTFGVQEADNDILQFYNPWDGGDLTLGAEIHTEEELLYGPIPNFDADPSLHDRHVFKGNNSVVGVVYHLNDNLSLVANMSDSVGFPNFNRTMWPQGTPEPPATGEGVDYGINFELFDNRIFGRLAYYETDQLGLPVGINNGGQFDRLYDTARLVVDNGLMTESEWDALDAQERFDRMDQNGDLSDKTSSGVELSLNANLTENWRLTFKASKVDRITTNYKKSMQSHLGYLPDTSTPAEWDLVLNPFDTDNETIDVSGFDPNGVLSQFLGFYQDLLDAGAFAEDITRIEDIVTVGNNNTVYTDMEIIGRNLNNSRLSNHKKWGLRPYNANVFSAYDFTEGFLKGFSFGAGLSWKDNMIIGEDEETRETWYSRELWDTNLMLRYKWANGFGGALDGPVTLQLNVSNVLDDQDIIPVAYLPNRGPIWEFPYDRGYAYSRYDVPLPRSWRLTLTYDF